MRAVSITLAALALALAVAGFAASSQPASGLRGIVLRGPTKPVCPEAEPCTEPAAGIVLRFSRSGLVVGQVKTGAAGGYTVRLRPGK